MSTLFEDLREGLQQAIDFEKGTGKAKTTVFMISPVTKYSNKEIKAIRKRDFYIRSITVGGQKEELYDEDDLIAMGYAFRKAGKMESKHINIKFSPEFEKNLRVSKQEA